MQSISREMYRIAGQIKKGALVNSIKMDENEPLKDAYNDLTYLANLLSDATEDESLNETNMNNERE
jgi:hypothetical protein